MESLCADFDELSFGQDKNIKKNLDPQEKIMMSCAIFKFNDYKKRQERNIMITNKAVYNFKEKSMKRKIDLKKIKAISVGTLGQEFVLHVPEEYDYRYSSQDKNRILTVLTKAIVDQNDGKKIPFFFKDEVCLFNYASTKGDKKKGMNRMPTEDATHLDSEDLKELITTRDD